MTRTVITPKMAEYIQSYYLKESTRSMAAKLGISRDAVARYMKRWGLIVPKATSDRFRIDALTGRTTFTAEEDRIIRENYLDLPIKTLGVKMGRSYTGIMGRIKSMGLSIPPHIIERNKKLGRIKPGDVPPNKGKKMSEYMTPEALARSAKTRFKKGNLPHNTAEADGEIRVRDVNRNPYYYIRLSLGKWVLLHKYNWEKIHGPVPAGYCLRAIDGNSLNADPANWKLITRKENRIINSGTVTLPDKRVAFYLSPRDKNLRKEFVKHPELIKLKRTQLLLNRAINEHL